MFTDVSTTVGRWRQQRKLQTSCCGNDSITLNVCMCRVNTCEQVNGTKVNDNKSATNMSNLRINQNLQYKKRYILPTCVCMWIVCVVIVSVCVFYGFGQPHSDYGGWAGAVGPQGQFYLQGQRWQTNPPLMAQGVGTACHPLALSELSDSHPAEVIAPSFCQRRGWTCRKGLGKLTSYCWTQWNKHIYH